jgi:hypothetical protein
MRRDALTSRLVPCGRAAIALAMAGACALASPAAGQFFENFEMTPPGPVCGQRGWEQWVGSQDVCGSVILGQAFSGQRSLLIVGAQGGQTGQGDDTVHRFGTVEGGRWIFRIRTFVPQGATGKGYVLLLSTYDDPPGSPVSDFRWSVQVGFNADNGLVEADFNAGTAPLVRGRWAEFKVEVDLDADTADYFYDGSRFVTGVSWTTLLGPGGQPRIEALDLYGGEPGQGGTTGMVFDDVRLYRNVPAPLPPQPRACPCDWNNNGRVNSQDFFDFLAAFFGGQADYNGDGLTNSQDFFDFLACFFAGCPEPEVMGGVRVVGGVHEVYFSVSDGAGGRRDVMSCAYDPGTLQEDWATERLFGMTADELLAITDQDAGLVLVQAYVRDINNVWQEPEDIPFDGTDAEIALAKRQSETMRGVTGAAGAAAPGWETNGCTMVPDFDFVDCCDQHDICYCQGGNEDARVACDEALRDCIANRGHPWLAEIYYAGVRAFGRSFFSYH